MINNEKKGFLEAIKKVDDTNIVLQYKFEGIFNNEIF